MRTTTGTATHWKPSSRPTTLKTDKDITSDEFIERFSGTAIHVSGTLINGASDQHLVDVVAAWNAVNDPDLLTDVGWTPTLLIEIQATHEVRPAVQAGAGPFTW